MWTIGGGLVGLGFGMLQMGVEVPCGLLGRAVGLVPCSEALEDFDDLSVFDFCLDAVLVGVLTWWCFCVGWGR